MHLFLNMFRAEAEPSRNKSQLSYAYRCLRCPVTFMTTWRNYFVLATKSLLRVMHDCSRHWFPPLTTKSGVRLPGALSDR